MKQGLLIKPGQCYPVVPFKPGKDKLALLDFTDKATGLTGEVLGDTGLFSRYIDRQLSQAGALYGIGGYGELRTVYSRSRVFDGFAGEEPRRLHLGVDIWGVAGTPVASPLDGIVHSFAFNDAFGDYGATIILLHLTGDQAFYSLFGHLSLADISGLSQGQLIAKGQTFAHIGPPAENGHWPPHLHYQLILDMEGRSGDYPGVCRESERAYYLENCPDADLVLQMMQYAR